MKCNMYSESREPWTWGCLTEYDVDKEINEAKWTDSDMCNDDAKRVSNPRWVVVRKE